ncbi:cobalamin biosynthesis protein CobD [Clostridium polyendosporum]|uniref:Cobalamin biosynthesis protein CobD n=1 Tax=Clostridium polyendosporum TaxID=69208 RepID=A0A919RXH5_9CLOT|nr:adenosylcobinamide-phosphate synthase CbiB [Clostridium polyendosporum]GIM28176.1 cobalamin biosynthesis protein CobD [Clostridium polyendosporum]
MIDIWVAFALDCILGDPYKFPHPVRFIGKYIAWFERVVTKRKRTKTSLRYIWGPFLTISTVALTFSVIFTILKIASSIHTYLYHSLNVILLWTSIAPCCLSKEGYKVYKPLKEGNIKEARERVSYLVSRDVKSLNEEGITRAAVETILENISDGIIAPLFYVFLGGAPLALAYKAVNTLDSMVGYRNEKYEDLGFFSAKADDLVNFIPARLSGFLISISALALGYNFKNSIRIFFRDRLKHKSPNSAHPEASGAGALGIRLGGPNLYFGKIVNKPYIGDELQSIKSEHIVHSIKLLYGATIIFLGICSLIYKIRFII